MKYSPSSTSPTPSPPVCPVTVEEIDRWKAPVQIFARECEEDQVVLQLSRSNSVEAIKTATGALTKLGRSGVQRAMIGLDDVVRYFAMVKPEFTASASPPIASRSESRSSREGQLELLSQWTYFLKRQPRRRIAMRKTSSRAGSEKRRVRGSRLGFRVDAQTKKLAEMAAALERRSLTNFCVTALTEATKATISRHETIQLSERDRQVFFNALVSPPKPTARLKRAFRSALEQVVS